MPLPHINRATLALASVLLGSSLLAHQLTPTTKVADSRPKTTLGQLFPASFGEWKVDANTPVILPAPDVQARLDKIYNQVLARTYVDSSGYRIMLSVAYGGDQSDGLSVHRPEICYPAQGFEVARITEGALELGGKSIPVTRLVTHLGARNEPVTYWIVNGDIAVGQRFQARLIQLKYGLKGLIADGMLIRISSIDSDPEHAFSAHASFAAELINGMSSIQQARVGAGSSPGSL